jgi:hypothetical protein
MWNVLRHLLLQNFLYLESYLSHNLCVYIFLFGGKPTRVKILVVFFLLDKFLGFWGFRLRPNQMFNLVNVLTSLKHYHLQVENLDGIIIVVKNW